MIMDKMREEFEAFYKDHMKSQGEWDFVINGQIESFRDGKSERGYAHIQEMWLFWQASRAALVVDVSSINVSDFTKRKIKIKLDDAGIKYE